MIRKYCLIVGAAVVALLSSCTRDDAQKMNPLVGAWEVYDADFLYDDRNFTIDDANVRVTALRIYTADSLVFNVCVTQEGDFREFIPASKQKYSLQKNEDGSVLYSEGGYKCQLTMMCDTAICLKKTGNVFYLRRTDAYDDDMDKLLQNLYSKGSDWKVKNTLAFTFYNSLKISKQEKEQKKTIDNMLIALGVVGVLVIALGVYFVISRRQKSLMRQQLKRLQDEKEHLTADHASAFLVAEQMFWNSEFYADFCSRIDRAVAFDEEYWLELEHQTNMAFPRFIPNLRSIVRLSQVEFRTCLLIKLKVAPSVMASIVHREATTISSIRSRLYKKVFDKKGTPQQWDEFILSI